MKIKIMTGILLMTLFGWFPQSAFAECKSGDCVGGKGIYVFPDGKTYEGTFKDGIPEGTGTFTYEDTHRQTGQGIVTYHTGGIYRGGVKGGKRDGKGVFEQSGGNVYEGTYVNDKKEGSGKLTFATGAVYVGEFSNDTMHGLGVMTNENGTRYEGGFEKGFPQGAGKFAYADGVILEAIFKKNLIEGGPGKMTFPDGRQFTGIFSPSGPGDEQAAGTMVFPDGRKVKGTLKKKDFFPDGK